MRILIIEDDKHIAEALSLTLSNQHFIVDTATDGQEGWEQAQMFDYDLILLDVVLPKIDGITLCRKLRATRENTPILLLTSRGTSEDKVKGLDAGADDYVVKPCNFEELSARIRAILRRGNESLSPVIKWGDLSLNPITCEVNYAGIFLNLTPKEYGIIKLLMHHNKRVFSCSAILDKLWSFEEIPTEDTVRAHIKGLRHKLKNAGAPKDLVQTVYGLGYRLKTPQQVIEDSPNSSNNEPAEAETKLEQKLTTEELQEAPKLTNSTANKESSVARDKAEKLNQAMAQIWERFKGSISDRLALLTEAVRAAQEDKLELELKQEAHREAHKLAGSLGTFGLDNSSKISQKIEEILATELPLKAEKISELSQLVNNLHAEVEREGKQNHETPPDDFKQLSPALGFNNNYGQKSSLLLIVSSDSLLSQDLIREAQKRDIQAQAFANISNFLKIIQNKNFPSLSLNSNVVLLDLDLDGNYEKILKQLAAKAPLMPVVVLARQGELSWRLKVAKFGVTAYLQKPVQPEVVINVVLDVLRDSRTQAKVMIVDDDRIILETLQNLLEAKGIKTLILDDERRFWETLEETVPDLLVLDVEMPHINGIELCQVLRHDPRWSKLPVLFLTSHTNVELRHQMFAAGADDYISKPFIESELVTRIFNRIKRTKSIL